MASLREFANRRVPVYVVVLFGAILLFGCFSLAVYFREVVYNDQLFIPSGIFGSEELEFGSMPALANGDFFNTVRDTFISEKKSFMEVNLSEMKLRYYENGQMLKEYPVLTKGKEGSWWETPAGIYKVEGKIRNHFSGFAKVYLPWSLPFQGNFFIHGWPYYPDDSPVSSSYSGGCIRLSTEDAEDLYGHVNTGTPVLVFEKDFEKDDFAYKPGIPGMGARVYLSADIKNNFVFAERASRDIVPIASITKLMTALVAVEYINIERTVMFGESMIASTSKPRLEAGESYSVYDLLHPLLLESSNEAAEAIAQYMGRGYFVKLMNQKAKAIGMSDTAFVDPSGAGAGNISTAQDLFALAKYLYNNRSFILAMSAGSSSSRTYGAPVFADLQNYNVYAGDMEFIGGKVGQTGVAGETILSVFESQLGGEIRPFVVIALGASDGDSESRRLRAWTKENY